MAAIVKASRQTERAENINCASRPCTRDAANVDEMLAQTIFVKCCIRFVSDAWRGAAQIEPYSSIELVHRHACCQSADASVRVGSRSALHTPAISLRSV
eukprot:2419843-Pleurochrysis_carterae.AAC.2